MSYAVAGLENRRLLRRLSASIRELEESRTRLATAADSERRRIERDLHDGAQQRLVAVLIRLGFAAEEIERDPDGAARLVLALGDEIERALEEIRTLAHGAYPATLAQRGIASALRDATRHAPLTVTVDPDGIKRYAPEVERAVYFTCLEAVQNAAKHASGATSVRISLRADHDLHFEVADDGSGLPPGYRAGSGITNIRDRISAVGGTVTLHSPIGQGTHVSGAIPLP